MFRLNLLRKIGPLSVGALLAAGTTGCFSAHSVNTRLYGPAEQPTARPDAPDVVVADERVIDDYELGYTPLGVQASFRTEHPDAGVTTVETIPAGGGRLAYEVGYIDDSGYPRTEVYTPRGRELTYKPTQLPYGDWREEAYGLRVRILPATRPSDTTAR
jgi:hypothetical protein